MPQVVTKLELHRVNDVLRNRGWAFHSQSGIGLRLTKADPSENGKFKTGRHKRILMTPVSKDALDEILKYSRDIRQAVEQIEAISIGAQLKPELNNSGDSGGMDPKVMEKLITQRIENEMAKLGEANQKKLDAAQAKLEKLEAELAAAKKKVPAKAAKKTSKKATRKPPKGGVVERLAARTEVELDENGEPILSEEQEAQLAKAMAGANRTE